MKTIDFVFFDAGGGHRAAANALKLSCEQQQRPWEIRLFNLQEALDSLDIFRKLTGIRLQDIYNQLLARGWTLGSPQLLPLMQMVIRVYTPACIRMLSRCFRERRPDLVVSLIPNLNRAVYGGLKDALPDVPYVTVLTDLADYPPHFWMEKQDQHFICGSARAVEQALAMGHPREQVHLVSGMVLHPRFYEEAPLDRNAERARLGLRPDLPVGLVLFGGQGSRVMLEIAERLDRSSLDLQLLMICGHNAKLKQQLEARSWRLPQFIEGFTREVPYYMRLADFFIGKPGPGSLSEALHKGLPVIVERNAWTLPQERYNTEWVLDNEVGLVVKSFREIEPAVRSLLEPEQYQRFRLSAAAMMNHAVFEIPGVLDRILNQR